MLGSRYTLDDLEAFARKDRACAELLQAFCRWLQQPHGGKKEPDHAGALAHAADRYLREFVVDCKELGPDHPDPALVRQYLGHWYIVHTLEPSHDEIDRAAEALTHLYRFLAGQEVVDGGTARAVAELLADTAYFHDRLERFWNLTPDEIPDWLAADDYRQRGG